MYSHPNTVDSAALNTAASYYLIPDPVIHQYKEACRVDAANTWAHFQSYVSGYKNAMLMHSVSPIRHEIASQMLFLWHIAHHRMNMAEHVFRKE